MHLKNSFDIPVKRIMTDNILTCSPDTTLLEATRLMKHEQLSSIVVVNENLIAIGIWSAADSKYLDFQDPNIYTISIKTVMSQSIQSLPMDMTVYEVLQYFYRQDITLVIITDENNLPFGLLSLSDLSFYHNYNDHLKDEQIIKVMDVEPLMLSGDISLYEATEELLRLNKDIAIVRYEDNSYGILSEYNIMCSVANQEIDQPIKKIATKAFDFLSPLDSLKRAHNLFVDYKLKDIIVFDHHIIVGLLSFNSFFKYVGVEKFNDISIAYQMSEVNNINIDLKLPEDVISRIIHSSLECIVVTNKDMIIQYVNPSLIYKTGYSKDEAIGRKPNLFYSGKQAPEFYQELRMKLDKYGFWVGEIWNRKKNGQLYLDLLKIITIRDAQNQVMYYVGFSSDITYIRRQEEKIRKLAYYDPLTKLPNRLLLEDRLNFLIAYSNRNKQKLAVLFIDLDKFEKINDTFGHLEGDNLLKLTAQRLVQTLRKSDTIARLAGDEFIVLLPNACDQTEVENTLQRLLIALSQPVIIKGQNIRIGCSIGVSFYPDDTLSAKTLVHYADIAMYQAKKSGRNAYFFYNKIERKIAKLDQTLQLNAIFREALEKNEGFYIEYQPIVNLDKELVSIEALARWSHPILGPISPNKFIAIAESTGLINSFSQLFCLKLIHQIKDWQLSYTDLVPISINLSFQQFWQPNFVETFITPFVEHDIPLEIIQLELTESVLFKKEQKIIPKLQKFNQLGCKIVIDDFGTGYSSLSYLHQLPVTSIKIDKSFIKGLHLNNKKDTIVSAIITMAKALGYTTVAEGVETQEQFDLLAKYSVDLIQGYFISKPLSADQISREWFT